MAIFVENPLQKRPIFMKNRFLDHFRPKTLKNKVIFEILVKKYVDIGGSEFSKMLIFRVEKSQ